jgi:HAD superfamily phosphatase
MALPLLVFDMDGVLVDVTESYREAIVRTAASFTGAEVSRDAIQEYKLRGGFNDDWALTHRIVADSGFDVPYERVKQRFQQLFLGDDGDGLILRERWIARPGLLEELSRRFRFAVFTGRPREEAILTINRCARGLVFDPMISAEDVSRPKPDPEGLLRLKAESPDGLWYVGDTVDDARCARAAGAPFIGVAAAAAPRRDELTALFQAEGARAVIEDVNQLEEVLKP